MGVIRVLIELITSPLDYPLWWLFFSWLIWSLLKWRNWSRPTLSIMLIYSTAVGISYIKAWQEFNACMGFELCAPYFPLFPFLAAVSFWFMVLYVPILIASKPQALFEPIRRNWWIAFPVVALAIWHISVGVARIIRFPGNFDLSDSATFASDIFFYPAMVMLLPWALWFLLKFFERPGPTLPTMFLYSLSTANAAMRVWTELRVCRYYSCKGIFSLPLFLAEVAMWFITLYVLMRLTLRIERHVTH